MSFIKNCIFASFFLCFSFSSTVAFSCLPYNYLSFTQTEAPYHTLHLKVSSFGSHKRYQASLKLEGNTIVTFYNCSSNQALRSDDFLDISCTKGGDTLQIFGGLGIFSSLNATLRRAEGNFMDFVVTP